MTIVGCRIDFAWIRGSLETFGLLNWMFHVSWSLTMRCRTACWKAAWAQQGVKLSILPVVRKQQQNILAGKYDNSIFDCTNLTVSWFGRSRCAAETVNVGNEHQKLVRSRSINVDKDVEDFHKLAEKGCKTYCSNGSKKQFQTFELIKMGKFLEVIVMIQWWQVHFSTVLRL